MKEFEKWAGPAFYYGKNPLDRPTLEAKRKAWKAALEWVQKMFETNINCGRYELPIFDILQEVEEELEDE